MILFLISYISLINRKLVSFSINCKWKVTSQTPKNIIKGESEAIICQL